MQRSAIAPNSQYFTFNENVTYCLQYIYGSTDIILRLHKKSLTQLHNEVYFIYAGGSGRLPMSRRADPSTADGHQD